MERSYVDHPIITVTAISSATIIGTIAVSVAFFFRSYIGSNSYGTPLQTSAQGR